MQRLGAKTKNEALGTPDVPPALRLWKFLLRAHRKGDEYRPEFCLNGWLYPRTGSPNLRAKEAFVVGYPVRRVQQHPWPLLTRCQQHPTPSGDNHKWPQTFPGVPWGTITPVENHCLRQMFLTPLGASYRQRAVTLFL